MFQTVLRVSRRMPRHSSSLQQLRSTASKAALATDTTTSQQDAARNPLVWGGVLAAAAAAGIAWDHQQNKQATDCCGIIGVVAHSKFDVR